MKKLAIALASTFLIGSAYAQPAAAPASSPPPAAKSSPAAMAKGDAKRDMRVERQIKDLHAKLKITPAEETQWAAVAKTMRDSAGDLDVAIDKRKSMSSATAIDDLNAYGDIAQAHADSVKKLSASFSPLYASMSPEQKMTADEVFTRRAPGGHKHAMSMK
jgi:protein CpxP